MLIQRLYTVKFSRRCLRGVALGSNWWCGTLTIGPRRAKVVNLGGDHLRMNVPAVRWGADAGVNIYVYFRTLRLIGKPPPFRASNALAQSAAKPNTNK